VQKSLQTKLKKNLQKKVICRTVKKNICALSIKNSLQKNYLVGNVSSADMVDQASSYTDQSVEMKALTRNRKLIEKIEAALRKITDDTYGYCEESSEPIGLKRLIARPIATLSIEAQEKHERNEKIYVED
jgi:DnaK suppressor protein